MANDLRTKETKAGDKGCCIGGIALFLVMIVGPFAAVLSKKGHDSAAIALVVLIAIGLITSLVATVVGLSKGAGPAPGASAEVACPVCGHRFTPPRITLATQAVIAQYGPNPVQCPTCKHIWSR
jgi:hypothetical protein